MNIEGWFPLGWTGWISLPRDSQESSPTPQFKSISFLALSLLYGPTLTSIHAAAATAAKSLQSCPTLCDPIDGSPSVSPIPGILQARTLEWVAISFSNAWKWSHSVMSDPQWPHGLQPSRLLHPWDFPGKSTGVGFHCLLHPYLTAGKTIDLTRWTFVSKVMSLLFNMLSKLVLAFLPRSKHVLISWLQSPFAVILEPKKIKSHCFHCFPIYLPWCGGTRFHDYHFLNVES